MIAKARAGIGRFTEATANQLLSLGLIDFGCVCNADLDAKFVKAAEAAGFVNLKGHRSVGGMRASIYNAMPIEGVEKLVDFMKEFRKNH